MSNPFLPKWEHIPDGEPRVFGDRVYIYGSHDSAASSDFCDYKLKVWSASVNDLNRWECHGDSFLTRDNADRGKDTDWTDNKLFAPDVVEKDGRYYLYAYIIGAKGCVGVSERPEGPFKLLSQYQSNISDEVTCNGWFIDPGVLVDDDGRVYIYCGFERSFMAEINAENMYEIIDDSLIEHIIPVEQPFAFFEGCSLRKIKDTYYMIYSPKIGSRLAYATSKSPTGPFEYRGFIVDNGEDYPGGNNHGSICEINGQWYVFYHRATNGTVMSRKACVEKIEILPDGSIPSVEMTSLGFEKSLSPYEITSAEIACVLKNGGMITELDTFTRIVTNIKNDTVVGYKYFDFGKDYSSETMNLSINIRGTGCRSKVKIVLDDPNDGEVIGECEIGTSSGVYTTRVKAITGKHAIYFIPNDGIESGWVKDMFEGRNLFEMVSFVFNK